MRMGVKDVSARWLKASKALKKEDQIYGQKMAEMARKHSREAFYALDDPLEAAVFSVLVEIMKRWRSRIMTLLRSNLYPVSLSQRLFQWKRQGRDRSLTG